MKNEFAGEVVRQARFLGIDVGAETLRIVELVRELGELRCVRRQAVEHGKRPAAALEQTLRQWGGAPPAGVGATGRLARLMLAHQVPTQQALARGYRFFMPERPATVVSIGSRGFCALEMREGGRQVFRENGRCSQGTGNFLRQLVERFSLSVEEASELCADVQRAAALSGRCPVILKTDMTHLANKGERREEVLAGLFDALCENVLALVKAGKSPSPVVLVGGVSRSRRVRNSFARLLGVSHCELRTLGEDGLFLEATGAAALAAENGWSAPPLGQLWRERVERPLETGAPLAQFLHRVRRLAPAPHEPAAGQMRPLILGLDIGSTGAKAVALDAEAGEAVWEGYRQTQGAPVAAAQALMGAFLASGVGGWPVVALGATGSGREIVGSLMITCYRQEAVYVLNEIAAHAAGALLYDSRVDTIFEIGGQDAKYIRLEGGRVVDCAMNEACSAGTGSFIEEQGGRFAGIRDVVHLSEEAMKADGLISLGQHCSVFMAEVIDEAVASGAAPRAIIAGLYDSVIQNYLNRVKGCRTVGRVIFCQGMPFASDALAAAVAKQTGSEVVVPPNPGTVGALGIACLARRELAWRGSPGLDMRRFLTAQVEQKTTFVCQSQSGCGGAGNRCRVERLETLVDGSRQTFTWGGSCSLYDQGVRRRKLPNRAPNPFAEREALLREMLQETGAGRGAKRVAMTDELMLKAHFPFFARFVQHLGFEVAWVSGANQETLKRGIQESQVPFCAPVQLYHGVAAAMRETRSEYLLAPLMRSTAHVGCEACCKTCPLVQGAPDLLRHTLTASGEGPALLTPEFQFGAGDYRSAEFLGSCKQLASLLGVPGAEWREAWERAVRAQERFDRQCREIGERALRFCKESGAVPVVVLGRPYTIYNPVLNANVPSLLREQGAVAVPIDCYPVDSDVPVFSRMYWGHGQRILRAARQVRASAGQYAVYCSNYACGPDSFNLHLFAYEMSGKPFAVIETDGHAGDAGTKTRLEAFLYCVEQDRQAGASRPAPNDVSSLARRSVTFAEAKAAGSTALIPWMGPASDVMAAVFRGAGVKAEALAIPDRESLRIGRRHTSGKECLPMCLTLGRLIERLSREPDRTFTCMMPETDGPCRFGMYNQLDRIVLERLGLSANCTFLTPHCNGYFDGLPAGFPVLLMAGVMAADHLLDTVLQVRPAERRLGAANSIYARYHRDMVALLERFARRAGLGLGAALWEVASGRLFGLRRLMARAADDLAAVRMDRELPEVLVVGEIYVRGDAFANDGVVEKLEALGCRVRMTPMHEWLMFVDACNRKAGRASWSDTVRCLVERRAKSAFRRVLEPRRLWREAPEIEAVLAASKAYVSGDLGGDAVLAIGRSLCDWRQGTIDAVVNVGPLECMPTRFVEAQLVHVAEKQGLPSLTLSYNGDPITPTALQSFAFDVQARHSRRCRQRCATC